MRRHLHLHGGESWSRVRGCIDEISLLKKTTFGFIFATEIPIVYRVDSQLFNGLGLPRIESELEEILAIIDDTLTIFIRDQLLYADVFIGIDCNVLTSSCSDYLNSLECCSIR